MRLRQIGASQWLIYVFITSLGERGLYRGNRFHLATVGEYIQNLVINIIRKKGTSALTTELLTESYEVKRRNTGFY